MQDLIREQFIGFLKTPQLLLPEHLLPYPQYLVEPIAEDPGSLDFVPFQSVLGKRMEEFFLFYVENFSEEEILAHNEQVIHHKETLGEIDFLLKNKVDQILHVELVYKFYLFDPVSGPVQIDKWIGPNRRDSLPKKLKRLQKKQFPLLFRKEARPLLERLKVSPEEIIQKVCFKAWLFLPDELPKKDYPEIPADAIAGFYIKWKDFDFDRFGSALFFSPLKKDWSISPEMNATWLSFDEINKLILPLLTRRQSPLLWMKTPAGSFERFFITWW